MQVRVSLVGNCAVRYRKFNKKTVTNWKLYFAKQRDDYYLFVICGLTFSYH